ncbi:MAG: CDP-alcohol phosphatidyltransferase family protein, partial [Patescibacteria group bacterium]
LRGVLSVILFICALQYYWLATAIISVLAFATDGLDGWLAHWLNAKSDLGGRFIDPANDTLLSVALVAGLFFTGIIGWGVIWFLAAFTVVIWIPIILLKDRWWRERFRDVSRYYCVAFITFFVAIYWYIAIGRAAAWLIIPALFAGFGVSYTRQSRRFVL